MDHESSRARRVKIDLGRVNMDHESNQARRVKIELEAQGKKWNSHRVKIESNSPHQDFNRSREMRTFG